MNDKATAHRKLGDVLEALDDVDGITVEESHLDEIQSGGGDGHPLAQMLGIQQMQAEPETEQVIHIIATLDDDRPDYPDEPDFDDDAGVNIGLDDDEEDDDAEPV